MTDRLLPLAHAFPFRTKDGQVIGPDFATSEPALCEKYTRQYYVVYGVCPPPFPRGFRAPAESVYDGDGVPADWNAVGARDGVYEYDPHPGDDAVHWDKLRGDRAAEVREERRADYDEAMTTQRYYNIDTIWTGNADKTINPDSDAEVENADSSLDDLAPRPTVLVPLNDKSTARGTPTAFGARRNTQPKVFGTSESRPPPGTLPSQSSQTAPTSAQASAQPFQPQAGSSQGRRSAPTFATTAAPTFATTSAPTFGASSTSMFGTNPFGTQSRLPRSRLSEVQNTPQSATPPNRMGGIGGLTGTGGGLDMHTPADDIPFGQSQSSAGVVRLQEQLLRQRMENEARIAEAQIAALNAQALNVAAAPNPGVRQADDVIPGETISPAIRNILLRTVPGVPSSQIIAIMKHEFVPENLYRLRKSYDRSRDEVDSTMELSDGNFVVKKAKGKQKDFGDNERIWSEGFLNYIRIIGYLFPQNIEVPLAMMRFHSRILELSRIYTWSAVFVLAMDYHHLIRSDSVLVTEPWLHIPEEFVYSYCTVATQRKNGGNGSGGSGGGSKNDRYSPYANPSNDPAVICNNFNTKGCSTAACKRKHECTKCHSKDHGANQCSK